MLSVHLCDRRINLWVKIATALLPFKTFLTLENGVSRKNEMMPSSRSINLS